jgi:hypothetical protein
MLHRNLKTLVGGCAARHPLRMFVTSRYLRNTVVGEGIKAEQETEDVRELDRLLRAVSTHNPSILFAIRKMNICQNV